VPESSECTSEVEARPVEIVGAENIDVGPAINPDKVI